MSLSYWHCSWMSMLMLCFMSVLLWVSFNLLYLFHLGALFFLNTAPIQDRTSFFYHMRTLTMLVCFQRDISNRIHESRAYLHTSTFSPTLSQLESPWTPYFICRMTGLFSNYRFQKISLFFFRCESGYTGQHCEKTDFSILYVVPSRQKLTHVLIAAIIGAVQIAIIVAIVMCITR